MKKDLQSRIMKYTAAASAVAAAPVIGNAQIVYTDVMPDQVVNAGGTYSLDVNNDATPDYYLGQSHQSFTYYSGLLNVDIESVGLITVAANQAVGYQTGGVTFLKAYSFGEFIDSTASDWLSAAGSSSQMVAAAHVVITGVQNQTFDTGQFVGQTDKYVGLRFDIAGAQHYGWVRIDVNSGSTQFTVKDYAYRSADSTGIYAGDNGSAVAEISILDLRYHTANGLLYTSISENLTNGKLIVMNTAGQQVFTTGLTQGNSTIDMGRLASGVYILNFSFNEGTKNGKVFVK